MDTTTNPWLQGVFAPVDDERDDHDLEVTGTLPDGLAGTFLRNGPNIRFDPVVRYHLFDGDGMLHGVTFDGEGGASYRNRWIRSAGLEAEEAAGHALFGGITEFRLPPDDVFATVGPIKNTANTHVVRHAGRILALLEACPPTEVAADLSTVGEYTFGGALSGPMTAHPKTDPVTGDMVFFGASPFPRYLQVHSADAAGTLTWSTEVDLPGAVMMHDFVITETKVVIFDLPVAMDVHRMLTGEAGFWWAPERGARIGVLERGAPGSSTRWIEVEPFWVFHFLNAFDVAGPDGRDVIEVVGCRAPQLNASFDGSTVDESIRPFLHRWRIDLATGSVTDQPLGDDPTDFPRINDEFAGRPHRYGWSGHATGMADGEAPFDGITKHDLHAGTSTTHTFGAGRVCGEAVFATDPARADVEDGGWLLSHVYDLATEQSSVAVLDAATLEPVADVHLRRRVPFGFHGSFLP